MSAEWKVWEVFLQAASGHPHVHAGNVHAADAEMALQSARDLYARRGPVVSIWVVPAALITATTAADEGPFFDSIDDKVYRHPRFYRTTPGTPPKGEE